MSPERAANEVRQAALKLSAPPGTLDMFSGFGPDVTVGAAMGNRANRSRSQVWTEPAPPDDHVESGPDRRAPAERLSPLMTLPFASLHPIDLLRIQRRAGNRATVGLMFPTRESHSVQRGSEEPEKKFPASALPVTAKAEVSVKGDPAHGKVTEVLVKKQLSDTEVDPTPHNPRAGTPAMPFDRGRKEGDRAAVTALAGEGARPRPVSDRQCPRAPTRPPAAQA